MVHLDQLTTVHDTMARPRGEIMKALHRPSRTHGIDHRAHGGYEIGRDAVARWRPMEMPLPGLRICALPLSFTRLRRYAKARTRPCFS